MIEKGEALNCEFKLKFSSFEKMAKEIIAFANTSGGYVIIGVDDNRNIVGVESEKTETELINETINNYCEPKIDISFEYFDIFGKEVVLVVIPESKNKPHRIQDYKSEMDIQTSQVYVRVNDKSVPASKEMIRVLRTGSSGLPLMKYSFGNLEKAVFNYLEKKETISVKELADEVNISQRRASRTLVNLVRAGLLIIHSNDKGENCFSGKQI